MRQKGGGDCLLRAPPTSCGELLRGATAPGGGGCTAGTCVSDTCPMDVLWGEEAVLLCRTCLVRLREAVVAKSGYLLSSCELCV